jgi:hypothetical protein
MNYTLVIMGIILVVIVYILYKVIDEKGRSIAGKMDLTSKQNGVPLKNTGKADSTRYYIGAWLYVNSLNGTKTIYSIGPSDTPFLKVEITDTAQLQYSIKNGDATTAYATRIIMNNFPLQKWVYVVISVDNNVVDLYIDGKLISSHKIDPTPTQISEGSDINFGIVNAFLAKMEREPKPMDPSYAWSKYMEGNGGNYFSRMLSNYGGTLTLTKNDMDVREFQLF